MPLSSIAPSPRSAAVAGDLVRAGEPYPAALTRALTERGHRVRTGRGAYGLGGGFTVFAVAARTSTAPDAPWAVMRSSDDFEATWRNPSPVLEAEHAKQGHGVTETVRAYFETAPVQQQWREDLVRRDLTALTTSNPVTGVTSPVRELAREGVTALMRAQQAVMLAVWWEDRMAEGHTIESARLLLSLTAHPTLMARTVVDPVTGAPSLRGHLP